jgi:hypothetical protein
VLSPAAVAQLEHIFRNPELASSSVFVGLSDGSLRSSGGGLSGGAEGGAVGPEQVRASLRRAERGGDRFALLLDTNVDGSRRPVVLLHSEAQSKDAAKALVAFFALRRLVDKPAATSSQPRGGYSGDAELLEAALAGATEDLPGILAALRGAGWSTERFMLPVARRLMWDSAQRPPAPPS